MLLLKLLYMYPGANVSMFLWYIYLGVKLLSHMGILYSTFCRTTKLFSTVVKKVSIPMSKV